MKSFKPKDGSGQPPAPGRNGEVDFRGEKRSNETHASTTDPESQIYKKLAGQAAKLSHLCHVLMENANGVVVAATLTKATGTAEREKAYDTADFVAEMRERGVTPHMAKNTKGRRSAIDGRTTRHPGYGVSQKKCNRIEAVSGWIKSAAGFRKARHRGTAAIDPATGAGIKRGCGIEYQGRCGLIALLHHLGKEHGKPKAQSGKLNPRSGPP